MAAAIAIILVVSALFALAYPFIYDYRIKKRRIDLNKQIEIWQKRIPVATTDAVPGRVTEKVLGPITGTSKIPASNDDERGLADREAMFSLIDQARRMGANAVVELNRATESYQHTEPRKFFFRTIQWTATKVIYTGKAVQVASTDSLGEGPRGT